MSGFMTVTTGSTHLVVFVVFFGNAVTDHFRELTTDVVPEALWNVSGKELLRGWRFWD